MLQHVSSHQLPTPSLCGIQVTQPTNAQGLPADRSAELSNLYKVHEAVQSRVAFANKKFSVIQGLIDQEMQVSKLQIHCVSTGLVLVYYDVRRSCSNRQSVLSVLCHGAM